MRLLKIGSSPACDIVVNSPFVSGHHADITMLDSGEILIEDKGSRNGTFVGPNRNRLRPGEEVPIRRGDLVRLGDTDLLWSRVPTVTPTEHGVRILNIGSNFRNDIVVSSGAVSRYHATIKIDKRGRAFITDNKSTNGTQINGMKITPGQPERIKRGDNIVVGEDDITAQIRPYLPSSGGWLKWIGSIGAAAAIIVGLIFGIGHIIRPNVNPTDSVVYVLHNFDYVITLTNNPYSVPLKLHYNSETIVQGTAFFIDDKGHLGTARHIVKPWDQAYNPDSIKAIKEQILQFSTVMFEASSYEFDELVAYNPLARQIKSAIDHNKNANVSFRQQFESVMLALAFGQYEISGETNEMLIGYPNRNYTHFEEFERADLVAESDNPDVDVAILQMNDKKTPYPKEKRFDIDRIYAGSYSPMTEDFISSGYPSGLYRALDVRSKSMVVNTFVSKVSKVPNRVIFELQYASTGGASGSPVYLKDGKLAGVLTGVYTGQGGTTHVVQVKHLKDLYDKEIR